MCNLSNKIKLCTCVDENTKIEDLNHYWILHRQNKGKDLEIMGMPIFPDHLHPRFEINAGILLKTLNSPEAFDKKIETANGDVIEIVLCNNDDTIGLFRYTYKYNGSAWVSDDTDCFELSNRYDEVNTGELKEI